MRQEIIFEVVAKTESPIGLTKDSHRKFPNRFLQFSEYRTIMISCEVDPAPGFDMDEFKKMIKRKLRSKYKALRVTELERVKGLE